MNMTRGGILTIDALDEGNQKPSARLLTVFAHLQIIAQIDRIGYNVVRPGSKVHIANGASRDQETSHQL